MLGVDSSTPSAKKPKINEEPENSNVSSCLDASSNAEAISDVSEISEIKASLLIPLNVDKVISVDEATQSEDDRLTVENTHNVQPLLEATHRMTTTSISLQVTDNVNQNNEDDNNDDGIEFKITSLAQPTPEITSTIPIGTGRPTTPTLQAGDLDDEDYNNSDNDIEIEIRPLPSTMSRKDHSPSASTLDVIVIHSQSDKASSSVEMNSSGTSHESSDQSEEQTTIGKENLPLENSEREEIVSHDNFVNVDSISNRNIDNQVDSFKWDPFSPKQIAHASKEYQPIDGNFLKGCKWSPDGLCLLTSSNDNLLRVYNLPTCLYGDSKEQSEEMNPVLQMKEGETIYDYDWYPGMSSYEAASCCLVSSCRDHPIHLWDAYDGKLRCSYRAFNHLDEIVAASSVAFSPDGSKIYSGYSNMIRIFNTTRPGREFTEVSLCSKGKKNVSQQKGIISCIASSPEHGGLYALGSFAKSVGVYSEKDNTALFVTTFHEGGVTMLKFSPDGYFMYSGGRKDSAIHCWDLRYFGHTLFSIKRDVQTNQKIQFDLSKNGDHLFTGETNGYVTVHNIKECITTDDYDNVPPSQILFSEKLHKDCVNGLSVHPSLPIVATSSGQRHYQLPDLLPDGDDPLENEVKIWKCL